MDEEFNKLKQNYIVYKEKLKKKEENVPKPENAVDGIASAKNETTVNSKVNLIDYASVKKKQDQLAQPKEKKSRRCGSCSRGK